jgi:Spy/CpxP family protein refolding chaperone
MQNAKGKRNQQSHIYGKYILAILASVALCGIVAWAQKSSNENKQGVTLVDLGVTEAQKTQLEELWNLKRQKDIQAINDLKTLNRLAKDSLVEDAEIQETLDKFRAKRKEMRVQIQEIEEDLVQTLPTQAQLHLTLMGVLDNGIPRRTKKVQTNKNMDDASKPSPKQTQ